MSGPQLAYTGAIQLFRSVSFQGEPVALPINNSP